MSCIWKVILAIVCCTLIGMMAVSRAVSPEDKPLSVEDEIRELKRRCDKLEGERTELQTKYDRADKDLQKAKQQIETTNRRIDSAAVQAALDRVPLGGVIPFFGSELPKGYRWCNGIAEDPRNVYPNAAWVPNRLVGKPLPDMREHLIGGAKNEVDVGLVYDKGKLTVPEIKVEGSKFTISGSDETRRLGDGSTYALTWQNEGGIETGKNIPPDKKLPNWFEAQANPKYRGFVMRLTMVPANCKVIRPGATCGGSQEFKDLTIPLTLASTNPRHVMCRWIIRVQ